MKGMSLEVRVGLMILAALSILSALAWGLKALDPPARSQPASGAQNRESHIVIRGHPPDGLSLECSPERIMVCRCEVEP